MKKKCLFHIFHRAHLSGTTVAVRNPILFGIETESCVELTSVFPEIPEMEDLRPPVLPTDHPDRTVRKILKETKPKDG